MMTSQFFENIQATSPPVMKAIGQAKKSRGPDNIPFAETLVREISSKSAAVKPKEESKQVFKPSSNQEVSSSAETTISIKEEAKDFTIACDQSNQKGQSVSSDTIIEIDPPKLAHNEQGQTEKLVETLEEKLSEQSISSSWQVLLHVIENSNNKQDNPLPISKGSEGEQIANLIKEAIPKLQNMSQEPDRLAEALLNLQQTLAESEGVSVTPQQLIAESEGALVTPQQVIAEFEKVLVNSQQVLTLFQSALDASQGLVKGEDSVNQKAVSDQQVIVSDKNKQSTTKAQSIIKEAGDVSVAKRLPEPEKAVSQRSAQYAEVLLHNNTQEGDDTTVVTQAGTSAKVTKFSDGNYQIPTPHLAIDDQQRNAASKVFTSADEQVIKEVLHKGSSEVQTSATAKQTEPLDALKREVEGVLQKSSEVKNSDGAQQGLPLSSPNQIHAVENKMKANEANTASSVFQQTITNLEAMLKGDHKFIRLQLYPEHLGGLEIKVSSQGGTLQINILADSALAQQALERHAQELQQVLQQSGVNLTGLTISQRQAQEGARQQHTSSGKRQTPTWVQEDEDMNGVDVIPSSSLQYDVVGSSRVDFLV